MTVKRAESGKRRTVRGRVLVVDDDVVLRTWFARALAAEHEVTAAADGRDALELIRGGQRFDVILTDLEMPGLGGREFIAEVAALDFQQYSRIVVLTATMPPWDLGVPVLRKPMDLDVLRDEVRARVQAARDARAAAIRAQRR